MSVTIYAVYTHFAISPSPQDLSRALVFPLSGMSRTNFFSCCVDQAASCSPSFSLGHLNDNTTESAVWVSAPTWWFQGVGCTPYTNVVHRHTHRQSQSDIYQKSKTSLNLQLDLLPNSFPDIFIKISFMLWFPKKCEKETEL